MMNNEDQPKAGNTNTETGEPQESTAAEQSASALDDAGVSALQAKVVEAIKTCYDPEIPVDIYELGLVYEVNVEPSSAVSVKMTLTSPACPSAMSLPGEVEDKIRVLASVKDVKVQVVWDPPWDPSKMSEAARLQLGMM